jgi:hypothetical protein
MMNLVMLLLLVAGIVSVGTSYVRSTPRVKYRPGRNSHVPPLIVGGLCFAIDLAYAAGSPLFGSAELFDFGFLGLALACVVATVVLLGYDPMRR